MAEPLRVLYLGESRADSVAAELRHGGYEPAVQCLNDREGLIAALAGNPDIAICDSVAGECGAMDALRTIHDRGVDLPLIVVSGRIPDSEVLAALAAGAADHLPRTDLMRLNAAVAREMRALGMRRERLRMEEQFRQSQKMEALGRLAAGVAHDFNNLLTIITGYSDLLLTSGPLDAGQRTGLEEIRRAAERGGALTYQLLAFSRRRTVEVRPVSLNGMLQHLERMFRRLLGEDIRLVTLLAAAPDTVECDPSRLEPVIMNLAANARDAMPNGGKLTIETSLVTVDAASVERHPSLKPGRYVTLSVTDTGVGMNQETRAHLFEPFFTTKAPGNGTGLGLATAYGAVSQIGGSIAITSQPGIGTKVEICLPLSKGKIKVTKGRASARKLSGKETILVVEDDEKVRKLIVGLLRGHGYTMLEATCGDEAKRLVKEHVGVVHLAIVDVVMPEMSGPELVRQIGPLFPKMRLLYISGYTDEAILHHRISESGEAFLQKPFLPEVLAAKVREVLGPRGNSAH